MPTSSPDTDIPTVARIRAKVRSFGREDLTVGEVRDAFGLVSNRPIVDRIEKGIFSGAKILGEWRIDRASIERYLDTINSNYNRTK